MSGGVSEISNYIDFIPKGECVKCDTISPCKCGYTVETYTDTQTEMVINNSKIYTPLFVDNPIPFSGC